MDISSIGQVNTVPAGSGNAAAWAAQRQLAQASTKVNQSGVLGRNQIVFSIDGETRRPVIRIEDRETHEVVEQIPPEYVMELARSLTPAATETMASRADT